MEEKKQLTTEERRLQRIAQLKAKLKQKLQEEWDENE